MSDFDYIPSEEDNISFVQGLPPDFTSDERFYTTRLTPKESPWGFMIGYDTVYGAPLRVSRSAAEYHGGAYIGSDEFGSIFGSVAHFVSNAAHVAGKAVDSVGHAVGSVTSKVGEAVKHIPLVGAPVTSIFSAAWHLATGPLDALDAIAHGQSVDKAMMGSLEGAVKDVKTIAAYAQVVISMVPGVGTVVSAAISSGVALMNGQPISEALVAGVAGAIPGGPLIRSALEMGYTGVKNAVNHDKLDIESLGKTALGGISDTLGLPPAAKNAALAGVAMTGNLARGVPPEMAVTKSAIDGLPLPANAKAGLHQANQLVQDLAHGKPVDKALLSAADHSLQFLPVSSDLKKQVIDAVNTGKGILTAKNPGQLLAVGIQAGLADKLIQSSGISKQAHSALVTGIALGTGAIKQAHRTTEITIHAWGKLSQSGIQQAKAVPAIAEGRRLVGAGTNGFDIGHGLLQMHSTVFDIMATRANLKNPADQKGFDMAVSQRIGQVTTAPNPKLSPAARAGYTMTVGMRGYMPEHKASIMTSITMNASAAVGAKAAVKDVVAAVQEGWLAKLLKFLGFHPAPATA